MHSCSWFTSNTEPQCGAPAPHRIVVNTPLYRATVWFCAEHKAAQEANFARRTARIPAARRPEVSIAD